MSKPNIKIELNDYIPFEQLTDREKACYEAGVNEHDYPFRWVFIGILLGIVIAYEILKYYHK